MTTAAIQRPICQRRLSLSRFAASSRCFAASSRCAAMSARSRSSALSYSACIVLMRSPPNQPENARPSVMPVTTAPKTSAKSHTFWFAMSTRSLS